MVGGQGLVDESAIEFENVAAQQVEIAAAG